MTDYAAIEAEIERTHSGGHFAYIMWCPFGIPGTCGATNIPIGILTQQKQVGGAFGLIDLACMDVLAGVLNSPHRLTEIDALLIDSIRADRLTPEMAHERFPGVRRTCYQTWYVTAPQPFYGCLGDAAENLKPKWSRHSGIPLSVVETWGRP